MDSYQGKVSRRSFLCYTSTAGALAAGGSALPAVTGAGPALAAEPAPDKVPAFKFEEATIAELQAAMQRGTLTSRRLVEAYIQRIRQIDLAGIQLNSVIEVNPEALEIADQLDRERRQSGARGPLHGIPILVKDNFATADRMETTAGSLPEPLRARPQPVRLQLGVGRGGLGQPGRRDAGDRDRRLDRLPVVDLRHRWHQADARPHQPLWRRPHRPQSGRHRPHVPHGGRRRRGARRHDRRGPARPRHRCQPGALLQGLHPVPRPQRPAWGPHRGVA